MSYYGNDRDRDTYRRDQDRSYGGSRDDGYGERRGEGQSGYGRRDDEDRGYGGRRDDGYGERRDEGQSGYGRRDDEDRGYGGRGGQDRGYGGGGSGGRREEGGYGGRDDTDRSYGGHRDYENSTSYSRNDTSDSYSRGRDEAPVFSSSYLDNSSSHRAGSPPKDSRARTDSTTLGVYSSELNARRSSTAQEKSREERTESIVRDRQGGGKEVDWTAAGGVARKVLDSVVEGYGRAAEKSHGIVKEENARINRDVDDGYVPPKESSFAKRLKEEKGAGEELRQEIAEKRENAREGFAGRLRDGKENDDTPGGFLDKVRDGVLDALTKK